MREFYLSVKVWIASIYYSSSLSSGLMNLLSNRITPLHNTLPKLQLFNNTMDTCMALIRAHICTTRESSYLCNLSAQTQITLSNKKNQKRESHEEKTGGFRSIASNCN